VQHPHINCSSGLQDISGKGSDTSNRPANSVDRSQEKEEKSFLDYNCHHFMRECIPDQISVHATPQEQQQQQQHRQWLKQWRQQWRQE